MSAVALKPSAPADELASSPAPGCFARNYQYDAVDRMWNVKLLPGEYHVTRAELIQSTVLGSCVAACLRDTRLGIGGMNHFMLPGDDGAGPASNTARYGDYAMDTLVRHLLGLGARHEDLEAKVFGGARVLSGLSLAKVGERNASFVLDYLEARRIRVAARDLADIYPRKVHFHPASGRVFVKRLSAQAIVTVAERERAYWQGLREPSVPALRGTQEK